ncbi:cytochrome P450 2K1-like [Plectropomus leopardus]|uniref:cytochrome P450 2K1-like n=1 Tax=Plectropomus leopardus TaxID=160734 RepID=UPI001C4C6E5A|nr:cytochrome P450 2K1-like [Plectropomus leopardus]
MLEDVFQSSSSVSLLVAIMGLLVLHLFYSCFSSHEKRREPPGPKPLPLLGNLLQLDLKRLDCSLVDLSKKYGPVFTVYLGQKKVVVLAGYRTVKQALVDHAKEFGDREITPIFYDFNKGHGLLFSNGDSWKEMRRFALSTLRDFGVGRKIGEGKIIEECHYLIEEFEQHEGKAFKNTQTINYAASNVMTAIMFGKRFEYKDPAFKDVVDRDHEAIRLTGSPSIQIYNMFPWLGPCLKNWRNLMKANEAYTKDIKTLIAELKETLKPDMCRCFVDVFLTRKIKLESTSSSILLGTALILFVMYTFFSNSDNRGKNPPGPRPLPLLGNLLELDLKTPSSTLYKLSKKYGSVFIFYFGPQKTVVLSGYKTVKEALVNHAEEFGGRYVDPIVHDLCDAYRGPLFSNGKLWKEMRRFTLTNLKDFGMGRKTAEEKIIEECHYLIKVFEKHEGKPFNPSKAVNYAVANIISAMIYGSRSEYSDPEFTRMVDRINDNLKLTGCPSMQLYSVFPRLFKWVGKRVLFMKNVAENRHQIKQLIGHLQETLNPQLCRGYVDSFLNQMQKLQDSGITDSYYNMETLVSCIGNLLSAGTDTTGNTLRWSVLFMTKYPQIQDQVQKELRRVVGSRQVLAEDRINLPYTNAVIHETQRMANILPIALPHTTNKDMTFKGYFIQKGTVVYPLLTSVLWDESEWETPHVFNPAHFLNKDGMFVKRDAFLPFSAGHRACLGEGLARMELFLFFTALLQHFCFIPPPGVTREELDMTPDVGFTKNPSPHELCAIRRV